MASKRYSGPNNYPTAFPEGEAVTFDVDAFDDAIRSQGVLFEHHEAMRCPVGVVDRDDTLRRPHDHHEGCQNGYIYTKSGSFQALLTGNGLTADHKDQGQGDSSTAQMTFPRFYAPDDCHPEEERRIYVAPYDRLYYKDERILVKNWDTLEAHPSGVDRPFFPAVQVLGDIVDARGERYVCGVDFVLVGGNVHWKGAHQPGQNSEIAGKGTIFSVMYLYRPYWYVRQMVHEIRVTQVEDPEEGRRIEKMPQAAVVQREFVFLNQERDDSSAATARMYRQPADGGIPSR